VTVAVTIAMRGSAKRAISAARALPAKDRLAQRADHPRRRRLLRAREQRVEAVLRGERLDRPRGFQ
jgi:hypothetical protein